MLNPYVCACGQASVQELFGPLTCGGTLLLAAPGGEKDTLYMARLCVTKRVSCIVIVPSALEVLLQARLCSSPQLSTCCFRLFLCDVQ